LQSEIDTNRSQSFRADQRTVELEGRVRLLERQLAALWLLLKEKTGLTDQELHEVARAADPTPEAGCCPACGRKLQIQNGVNCSSCGHRLDPLPHRVAGNEPG
jgi:hypothetical protein